MKTLGYAFRHHHMYKGSQISPDAVRGKASNVVENIGLREIQQPVRQVVWTSIGLHLEDRITEETG